MCHVTRVVIAELVKLGEEKGLKPEI